VGGFGFKNILENISKNRLWVPDVELAA